ncbi:MAG: hypothetical protein EB127_23165 [Alphaproteobacteria bacterium]|nr:hypothetical protein [Alphaproteobacteria bacterium]
MDAPSFIFEMLEEEITRIQEELLVKVATKYHLNSEDLISEFVVGRVKLIPTNKVNVVVKKEITRKTVVDDTSRCMARIWNRGKGGQCTRAKLCDSMFCNQHINKHKHGCINEPVNKSIFPKEPTALYK